MNASRLFLIALLLGGRVVGAAPASEWVQTLSSNDHAARLAAINALESRIAQASAPSADAKQRAALERELLGYVASPELPELSRAYLIRLLPPIASEATVEQMLQLVMSAQTSRMLGNDAAGLLGVLGAITPPARLLQSLQAASDPARELLWSAVALRADPRLAKPLVKLWQQKKLPLDDLGIQALGAMGGRDAAAFLSAQWKQAEGARRIALARALVHTGAAKPAELRELCLRSEAPEIRAAALRQWVPQQEKAAGQFVQSQLDAGVPDVDALVAVQLAVGGRASWAEITKRGSTLSESTLITVLQSIREQQREDLEPWVLQRLAGASEAVEMAAVRCLAVVGGSPSIDALVARAGSSSNKLSAEAMKSLAVLKDKALDARLKEAIANPQHPYYLTALELVSLRNSAGSVTYYNQLFAARSPRGDELAAGLRGMERLGNIDSVKLLVARLRTETDPAVVRALQIAIKRVAIRLEQPDRIWQEAILPALSPPAGVELEARLLPILDAVASPAALARCIERVNGGDAILVRAAEQALIRWRDLAVCDYWLSVINDPTKTEAAVEQAVRYLDLTLRSDAQADSQRQVAEKAAKLFLVTENKALRTKLLALVGGMPSRWKAGFHKEVSARPSVLSEYREQLHALIKP